MTPGEKLAEKRGITGNELFDRIVKSGRTIRCEVAGCRCEERDRLQTHHVVPVRIRAWHDPSNLVLLCMAHHALIERYYWRCMSKIAPQTARDIRRIARMFKARTIPYGQVYKYRDETDYLWRTMNHLTDDPDWWRNVYNDALQWAAKQQTIRPVLPSEAIAELAPWWIPKLGA